MPEIGAPIPGKSKRCHACKKVKPLAQFHKDARSKDGLWYCCKPCTLKRVNDNRIKRSRNLPKLPPSGMKTCKGCKDKKPLTSFNTDRSYSDHRYPLCKPCYKSFWRPQSLRHQYGMSESQYLQMLSKQGGVCAICRNPETHTRHGQVLLLSVDHDHVTGKIRGLLCSRCNRALGLLKESTQVLESAIQYLKRYSN